METPAQAQVDLTDEDLNRLAEEIANALDDLQFQTDTDGQQPSSSSSSFWTMERVKDISASKEDSLELSKRLLLEVARGAAQEGATATNDDEESQSVVSSLSSWEDFIACPEFTRHVPSWVVQGNSNDNSSPILVLEIVLYLAASLQRHRLAPEQNSSSSFSQQVKEWDDDAQLLADLSTEQEAMVHRLYKLMKADYMDRVQSMRKRLEILQADLQQPLLVQQMPVSNTSSSTTKSIPDSTEIPQTSMTKNPGQQSALLNLESLIQHFATKPHSSPMFRHDDDDDDDDGASSPSAAAPQQLVAVYDRGGRVTDAEQRVTMPAWSEQARKGGAASAPNRRNNNSKQKRQSNSNMKT